MQPGESRVWSRGSEGGGMDWDDLFPVFAIAAVASFVLLLKSFFDVRALRAQLAGLTDKLPMYDHRLLRLAERIDGLATAPPPAEPAPPTVAEAPPTPAPEPVREQPVEPAPVSPRRPKRSRP